MQNLALNEWRQESNLQKAEDHRIFKSISVSRRVSDLDHLDASATCLDPMLQRFACLSRDAEISRQVYASS